MFSEICDLLKPFKDRQFLVSQKAVYSYQDLIDKIQNLQKNVLARFSQNVLGLHGNYDLDTIATLLVLLKNKNTVAILPENSAQQSELARASGCQYLINTSQQDWQKQIESIDTPVSYPQITDLHAKNHSGLIVYSTGSTGKLKKILHNADVIFEKFRSKKTPLRTISLYFFDHFGGLNTLFRTLLSGGTIIVPKSRLPGDVIECCQKHQAELLPCTPTFLSFLINSAESNPEDLKTLKIISYGAEAMPPELLKKVNRLLPKTELRQVYGLSEFGIIPATSKSSDSLWLKLHKTRGFDYKVKNDTLWVKGPTAMIDYLGEDGPFDSEGWLDTGDKVEQKEGLIKIVGRENQMIRVADFRIDPNTVENVIQQHPNVIDSRVYSEPHQLLNEVVCADVQIIDASLENESFLQIKKLVSEKLDKYHTPLVIRRVDSIPQNRLKKARS